MNEFPSKPRSMKRLAIAGSTWILIGFTANRLLRFGGIFVLTRLLFPEAFGLMALVNAVVFGLQMFSDLGLGPSIIQNKRGSEPSFLHTAWTLQVIRGIGLWCAALIVAPVIAAVYDEPRLWIYLSAASFSVVFAGLNSTNWHLQTRELTIGKLTLIELASQAVSLSVMIGCAYQWHSIWSLVIGALVRAFLTMALSHLFLGTPRMRFRVDRPLAFEIFHFSKWVFLASIFTFFVNRFDRLLLGSAMSLDQLGVYSIAAVLAALAAEFTRSFSSRVMLPLYAKTIHETPDKLRARSIRLRRPLLFATLSLTVSLVIWGPEIVNLLFDDRYESAGPLLQILAAGGVVSCVLIPMSSVVLASGNSFLHMLILASRSALVVGLMLVGGWMGGSMGMIVGLSVAPIFHYPILVSLIRRYNVWVPSLDFAAFALSALAIGLGLWLK